MAGLGLRVYWEPEAPSGLGDVAGSAASCVAVAWAACLGQLQQCSLETGSNPVTVAVWQSAQAVHGCVHGQQCDCWIWVYA
jgi:hypothetical protein